MSSPLVQIQSITANQNELVTWSQLIAAGLQKRHIAASVRDGLLVRVRPQVYSLGGLRQTWTRTLHAAVLAAGPDAIASHASAAALWGFKHLPADALEVTLPRERVVELNGVRVHRTLILPSCDRALRDGVPCTSFARTLCDNTTGLSEFQLSVNLDDGLRRDLVSMKALAACVERLESGPGRRLAQIRRLIAQRGPFFNPGGSNAELRVLRVLTEADLPLPEQQYRVRVGRKTYVLDYAYPERKHFIEFYELGSHGTRSAVAYDSERLTQLSKLGWQPLIFTDSTPDHQIVEDVAEMLGLL